MTRFVCLVVLMLSLATSGWGQQPTSQLIPNDPSQNPLGAKAKITAGFPGSLDTDVRLILSVSNPTQGPVTFNLAETLFVVGDQQLGKPLYAERMVPSQLDVGHTVQLHFRYPNPDKVPLVSGYVLLDFNTGGQRQRTALFIVGPKQTGLGTNWQHYFFPEGHVSGLYADPWGFYAP